VPSGCTRGASPVLVIILRVTITLVHAGEVSFAHDHACSAPELHELWGAPRCGVAADHGGRWSEQLWQINFLHFVDTIQQHGGSLPTRWHRPPVAGVPLEIEWDLEDSPGEGLRARYQLQLHRPDAAGSSQFFENVWVGAAHRFRNKGPFGATTNATFGSSLILDWPARATANQLRTNSHVRNAIGAQLLPELDQIDELMQPILRARHVHLRMESLRQANQLQSNVALDPQGALLSALLANWVLEKPEKMQQFNSIIARCLPEMKRALVKCPGPGMVQVLFEQKDGEQFDAASVSDGVVVFAGLIAHALEAPSGGLVLMEEPERGIHPQRLDALVDLLRTLVAERKTQFILSTHSPALLNQFRDEPEAVLLFRRGPQGTQIRCLADTKDVAEILSKTDPGALLANGVFNEELQ
jgi:AAA domain, putative AbiEii toxin, Type IV TA system